MVLCLKCWKQVSPKQLPSVHLSSLSYWITCSRFSYQAFLSHETQSFPIPQQRWLREEERPAIETPQGKLQCQKTRPQVSWFILTFPETALHTHRPEPQHRPQALSSPSSMGGGCLLEVLQSHSVVSGKQSRGTKLSSPLSCLLPPCYGCGRPSCPSASRHSYYSTFITLSLSKPTVGSDGHAHWFASESRATTVKTTLSFKILKMWALTQSAQKFYIQTASCQPPALPHPSWVSKINDTLNIPGDSILRANTEVKILPRVLSFKKSHDS